MKPRIPQGANTNVNDSSCLDSSSNSVLFKDTVEKPVRLVEFRRYNVKAFLLSLKTPRMIGSSVYTEIL